MKPQWVNYVFYLVSSLSVITYCGCFSDVLSWIVGMAKTTIRNPLLLTARLCAQISTSRYVCFLFTAVKRHSLMWILCMKYWCYYHEDGMLYKTWWNIMRTIVSLLQILWGICIMWCHISVMATGLFVQKFYWANHKETIKALLFCHM